MENGILKGWIMLIKKFTVVFLTVIAAGLSAQSLKPMTQEEFRYYEYQVSSGKIEQYRNPTMNEQAWKDLMNDIIAQIIEVHVPQNIRDWKQKGSTKVPSRNKIRLLAHRLRTLIENPELVEVSRQQLNWFKNIGNGFIELENIQTKMVRAVMGGNEKAYKELLYQYMMTSKKLKKLMDDREKWQLSRKELDFVRKKNLAVRRKKAEELKRRYELTRKLLKEGKLTWTIKPKNSDKSNQKNDKKAGQKENKKQMNNRRGAGR